MQHVSPRIADWQTKVLNVDRELVRRSRGCDRNERSKDRAVNLEGIRLCAHKPPLSAKGLNGRLWVDSGRCYSAPVDMEPELLKIRRERRRGNNATA